MKNGYLFVAILCVHFVGSTCFAQNRTKDKISDWRGLSIANHQKNKWLVGAGATLLGATVKAGRFVANRTWLGVEAESHSLLSDRREVGIFARYYLWNGGLMSGFSELGTSYGRFQGWNWNFDTIEPPQPIYHTVKLNVAFGLECLISRRVSLEGVAKVGRLAAVNWVQPSFQGSINVYFGQ